MLPYIKLFRDASATIDLLSDPEAGRLLKALMHYANDQEEDLPGKEMLVFTMLKAQMDRDAEAYRAYLEKQRENGSKGGRPRNDSKPSGFEENPENPGVFSETQKSRTGQEKEKELDRTPKRARERKGVGSKDGRPTARDYDQRQYTEEELASVGEDVILMALEKNERASMEGA